MNPQPARDRTTLCYAIGILGSFLIVAALVWAMRHYTQPPPLGEDRVALRKKALAELRAAEAEELNTYGWLDQGKGDRPPADRGGDEAGLARLAESGRRTLQPHRPRRESHRRPAQSARETQPLRVNEVPRVCQWNPGRIPMPKSEGRKKPEIRSPNGRLAASGFEFRPSFGLRTSAFGFRLPFLHR